MDKFLIEVSARHVHLKKEDLHTLFGEGYELTHVKDLSQPGEFASNERVNIIGPKNTIKNVIVLGPTRAATQAEVSLTDCFSLGTIAPVRESGDLSGSGKLTLEGPCGKVELDEGLIVAKRHIHMTPADAERFGVEDKQIVCVEAHTDRKVVFCDVVVRVRDTFSLAMHIDTDEANAANVGRNGADGSINSCC